MALAKYYEDILERLNDNIDSVKLLSKEENRNFISDERWNQIIAALNKQIVKAESIINKIRNDNNQLSLSLGHRLTELESENEQLRAENNELTQKISQIAEIVNIGSLFKIQETNIEPEYLQAVIYKQDTKKKSSTHL
jgi:seryl-tRNA synthetase